MISSFADCTDALESSARCCSALPTDRFPKAMAMTACDTLCTGYFLIVLLAAAMIGASGCRESSALTPNSPESIQSASGNGEPEEITQMWEMTAEGKRRAGLPWQEAVAIRMSEVKVRDLPRIVNSLGMELVEVPAGEFQMGSPDDDRWARPDEKPVHSVRIEHPYYMSVYEVTKAQFAEFVKATGYTTTAELTGEGGFAYDAGSQRLVPNPNSSWRYTGFDQDENHPVVNVTWDDAKAFCEWISRKENVTYRLPTEQEWEYACRGGTTTYWYTGSTEEATIGAGNVCDRQLEAMYPFATWSMPWDDGYAFTAPVGSYSPNPFGLHDMLGNVFEWCDDQWTATNYDGLPVPDPNEPDVADSRIIRGGSFLSLILFTRSADRVALNQGNRAAITGFRPVRETSPARPQGADHERGNTE